MVVTAIMAVTAITLTSCNQTRPPKADLKTTNDTLSYIIGGGLGNELVESGMLQQLKVDSAYLGEFMRGVNDVISAKEDKEKAAYFAGIEIGGQLAKQILPNIERNYFGDDTTSTFSREIVYAAFYNILTKNDGAISKDSITVLYQKFMIDMQTKARERQQAEYMKMMEEANAQKAEEEGAGEEGETEESAE